jgi:histidyl-tRNA synthetase
VIHDLLRALGFEDFTIRVNDRRLLSSLLESLDLQAKQASILRVIDKLDKQAKRACSRS